MPAPRKLLLTLALVAILGGTSAAHGQTLPEGTQETQSLYLQVWVNQVPHPPLVPVSQTGEALTISQESWEAMGLTWPLPGQPTATLGELAGMEWDYSSSNQTLHLVVPIAWMTSGPNRIGPEAREVTYVGEVTPGLLWNYDAAANASEGRLQGGLWNEWRVMGVAGGVASTSVSTRYSDARTSGSAFQHVRLDTVWERSFQDKMINLRVGDTLAGGQSWSRTTRMGGLQIARDFSLQPYRLTTPLASFEGEAALPSTVDLFIDGTRQSSEKVPPGTFLIDNIPMITGSGTAQIVVTDINGRAQVVSVPLYGNAFLLQKGLWDGQATVGFVRRSYSQKSNSYDSEPALNTSARYGLTNYLTVETHVEASERVRVMGGGALVKLGERYGVIGASHSTSEYDGWDSGNRRSIDYQWNNKRMSFAVGRRWQDTHFVDLASDAQYANAVDSRYAFAGVNLTRGNIGIGFAQNSEEGQPDYKVFNLNASYPLKNKAFITGALSQSHTGRGKDFSAQVNLYVPLGRDRSMFVGAQGGSSKGVSVDVSDPAPSHGQGWGWRAAASYDGQTTLRGQLDRVADYGEWTVGGEHSDGVTGYAYARGSLVNMGGGWHATRPITSSFAVVQTSAMPGIPVLLENRPAGVTNNKGSLLVRGLNPYQQNKISIDHSLIPIDYRIDKVQLNAVPVNGAGTRVNFDITKIETFEIQLVHADGTYPTPGAVAVKQGGGDDLSAQKMVGHDGLVYLETPLPSAGEQWQVINGEDEAACYFTMPTLESTPSAKRLTVACQPQGN